MDDLLLRLRQKGNLGGDSPRVSLGVVLACVTAVLGAAVVLIMTNASLVADGSFYLLTAVKWGKPCTCAPGRQDINLVREGPLLLAVHHGVSNTHVLTILEGIGFILFPALVWTLVLVLSRGSRLRFFFVAISCALCFATMIFFSVGELTLALPLIVLASVLLTRATPWSGRTAALAIVSTALLFFSYQAVAPCAVLLGVLAAVRIKAGIGSIDARASVVVLVLSVAVLGGAVWTVVFWPIPSTDSFVSLPYSTVVLFFGAFFLIVGAVLQGLPFGPKRLGWVFFILAIPFALYGIRLAISGGPSAAYSARGPCLILVAALQVLLVADLILQLWGPANWTVKLSPHATSAAAIFLIALVTIPIVCALRWSTVVGDFRQTITHHKGFVPATSVTSSEGSSYLWPWTNTTMSVILRSSTSNAVVENTSLTPDIPFSIGSAENQIPAPYRWEKLGVLAVSIPTATVVIVPADGATVSGSQVLDAAASANLTSVRFEITGGALRDQVVIKGTRSVDGWVGRWQTNTVANGTYTLKSVASTVDHVSVESADITITVNNASTTS